MLRTLILSPNTRDSFRVTVAHVLEVDKKVLICSSGYNSGNDGRTSCTGCDPIKTFWNIQVSVTSISATDSQVRTTLYRIINSTKRKSLNGR